MTLPTVNNKDIRTTNSIISMSFWLPWTSPHCLYLTLSRYLLAEFLMQELFWKQRKFKVQNSHDSQLAIHTNKTRLIKKITWINQSHESHESFRPPSYFVVSPVVLIVSGVVARPLLLLKQAYSTFYMN